MDHHEFSIGGYFPGSIGCVVRAHGLYYHKNWGFDVSFESQVARELGEFMGRYNPRHDGFWTANSHGTFAGSVAIDGCHGNPDGARLRWFIVEPEHRGKGMGRAMLSEAIEFTRNSGCKKIYLWTFRGLEAARTLYERNGFVIVEESKVIQWGGTVLEQKYELTF